MVSFSRIYAYMLLSSLMLVFALPVYGEININIENKTNEKASGSIMEQVTVAGDSAGLNSEDPRTYIGAGIKVVLSITGSLFLMLIVFAGYVRLTAQGEEERIKKSNSTAIAAVLGLSIVLLAYGITLFVTSRLYNAATLEPPYEENNAHMDTTQEKSINLKVF